MSLMELAFEDGQWDALAMYKLAEPRATNPTVRNSTLLSGAAPKPELSSSAQQQLQPTTDPNTVKQVFNVHEQSRTRLEPARKMAAAVCTTCRKPKHYGPCTKPTKTKPVGDPHKAADFNPGLTADSPNAPTGDPPSTSPGYHSAVSSVSSLAQAPEGRPADEQANTMFADLFRHSGISSAPNEPGRMYGGLNKTAFPAFEQRGPTVNPYEERLQRMSTPLGWGQDAKGRIDLAFDQIDNAVDSTGIEGNSAPAEGPAALG